MESATVTGPASEEIHTDELGRVRVHFHWDREGASDETSSCWVPVSQPWAGAGFGAICLPRVGQEVLVDFLGADPDRPMVVGRVYTATTPAPYSLPKNKMVSGIRSESYPRGKGAAGQARMGGGPMSHERALGGRAPIVMEAAPAADVTSSVANVGEPPPYPAGGGMPVGQLGADPSQPSTADAGHNEITFDDTAGAEQINVHAAHDYHRIVQHDSFVTVKHDDFLTVEHNKTDVIKRAYSMTAGSVSIGTESYRLDSGNTKMYSNTNTYIGSLDCTTVFAGDRVRVKGPEVKLITQTETTYIKVTDGSILAYSSSQMTLFVSGASILLSHGKIVLTAGPSSITMDKAGITLVAPMIDLNP